MNRVAVVALALATTISAAPAIAQEEVLDDPTDLLESIHEDEQDREFVVAPVPILNPTLGTGLAAVAMYLYQLDEGSQPSFTAAGAAYTDSDSFGYGIAQVAHFKDDAWKVKAAAVGFNLNLEYYGIGNILGDNDLSIPYSQDGWFAGAEGLRRIKGHWYGGIQYWYASVTTSIKTTPQGIVLPPEIGIDSKIAGLGFIVEYDSRDNRFNPHRGQLFDGKWSISNETIGSDFDFESTQIEYNTYHELNPTSVLAARGTLCMTPGDAPFYALCQFGQGGDLRGYVSGRYRDETMVTVQAEYRWNFYKNFGMVAFAGIGQVGESLSDYNTSNILPSAGIGLRYKISKTTGLNLSVDYAVGEDSDAWYFTVGESF
ncbi:MAG: BamA/TamA family outer membrane protein [bacterium]|nr:BamA/TamA family outer membrane protein [bacterium]